MMVAEPYNKKLNCRREKNACYSILGLLFLLSASMFAISFSTSLEGTSTRVYLWVLSCSLFVISSTVVLFLLSFCNTCGGCHIEDSESGLARMQDDLFDKEKSMSPASTLTPHDVPDLQQFHPGPIPPRASRESVDSRGNALSNIEEESIEAQDEISDCETLSLVMRPPTASLSPERKELAPQSKMPYLADGSEAISSSPRISPAVAPEGQRIWEFEKNWTTWNGGSTPVQPTEHKERDQPLLAEKK